MGDADVLAKLSRIIETHHISHDGEDENISIEDLLNSIGQEGSSHIERSNHEQRSPVRTRRNDEGYYERPTPYEVWEAKQNEKFAFQPKEKKKLNEQQWDRLVDHLHRTNKMKESALMKEQNQGLALELDGLSFKPEMNPTSLQLASTMKSLQQRLPGMASKRAAAMAKRREEVKEREMENCTFTPKREGAKTSEKYLQRMGKTKSTPDDFFNYHKEKLRRNDQRKQIVDEIESRELTFHPQLNARSKKLQEKMMQRSVIEVDPVSRQTVSMRKKHADAETEATGKTGQTSHVPEISSRAKAYKGGGSEGPVHERLYNRAVQQLTASQNKQVDILQNKLNISLKPWEATPRTPNGSYSWTQNKTHYAKAKRSVNHLIDDANKPVTVVEFEDSLSDLWRDMRTALPSDEFLQRDMDNEDDMGGPAAEL